MNEQNPTPTPEQIAWAAGLFEGEGCFGAYSRVSGRGNKVNVQARIGMTDRDVIERFASIMGCGSIRVVDRSWRQEKTVYEWITQRRDNVIRIIGWFMPYLGDRRRAKAEEILALGPARPKNERTHCPQGHPYAGANLRLESIERNGTQYQARRCKACRVEQERRRAKQRKEASS